MGRSGDSLDPLTVALGETWMDGRLARGDLGDCRSWDLTSQTLATVLVVVCTVLTGLLALSWLQNRNVPAFGMWTISFALCSAAAGFVVARDRFPGLLGIDIANALRLLAIGIGWQAARNFTGRKGNWLLALAPSLAWLAASASSVFGDDLRLRVLVTSPVVAIGAFAIACELWRASPRAPWIARLAAVLLIDPWRGLHRALPVSSCSWRVRVSRLGSSMAGPFHPIAILEALVLAVALAFLLLSAAKDEIGLRHREAALIDPLTGVLNRRGFEAEAERMLLRAGARRFLDRAAAARSRSLQGGQRHVGDIRSAISRCSRLPRPWRRSCAAGMSSAGSAARNSRSRSPATGPIRRRCWRSACERAVAALAIRDGEALDRADGQHRRCSASRRDLARQADGARRRGALPGQGRRPQSGGTRADADDGKGGACSRPRGQVSPPEEARAAYFGS